MESCTFRPRYHSYNSSKARKRPLSWLRIFLQCALAISGEEEVCASYLRLESLHLLESCRKLGASPIPGLHKSTRISAYEEIDLSLLSVCRSVSKERPSARSTPWVWVVLQWESSFFHQRIRRVLLQCIVQIVCLLLKRALANLPKKRTDEEHGMTNEAVVQHLLNYGSSSGPAGRKRRMAPNVNVSERDSLVVSFRFRDGFFVSFSYTRLKAQARLAAHT